jgi:hypothetical protein
MAAALRFAASGDMLRSTPSLALLPPSCFWRMKEAPSRDVGCPTSNSEFSDSDHGYWVNAIPWKPSVEAPSKPLQSPFEAPCDVLCVLQLAGGHELRRTMREVERKRDSGSCEQSLRRAAAPQPPTQRDSWLPGVPPASASPELQSVDSCAQS